MAFLLNKTSLSVLRSNSHKDGDSLTLSRRGFHVEPGPLEKAHLDMAAYAVLVSLMNILEQIKNHPRFLASFDKYQIESLGETIDFFLDFVESYNSNRAITEEEAEELESQIAAAAHEAEDVIESHIVNQILPGSTETSDVRLHSRCLSGLQKVILDMDSIKNDVVRVKEESGFNDPKPTSSTPAASSTPLATGKSSMVGFDDEFHQLMDALIAQESSRRIISIVGMGGSGKTTLAKNVYQDSLTMYHFDLRAWATISQEYNVRDVLLQLLCLEEKPTNETVGELEERLYKSLCGRRYLIILDDMWSPEVWDNIKFLFPDNGNGSRVILTTRLSKVSTDLSAFLLRINLLNELKSWNLFCQKVFGKEDCPLELVGIGKKIVELCKGLPLSIVVIGGLLRKNRTEEYWHNVAKDIHSILNSRESWEWLDVLYLSYSHLPAHLKPCFLYIGTYGEDYLISVSEIIKLWVAEGFLKPNGVQLLEEIAEDYLKDLIDRNLILVCARRRNGKIKSFQIHDLVRGLCLRVADKVKFFSVVRADSIPQGIDTGCRLIFHGEASSNRNSKVFKAIQSASQANSLLCSIAEPSVKCRLLRVLKKVESVKAEFQNVNMRYFSFVAHFTWDSFLLPSSISLIWNLQTLIVNMDYDLTVAPLEIWKMLQLRHLQCTQILLPDPPTSDNEDDDSVVLGNLQTLRKVVNFRLSKEVCKRIPNIRKLRLIFGGFWKGYDDHLCENLQNLGRLHKLESLHIQCSWRAQISSNELKNTFPSSLNKLTLCGCRLHWEDLSMIVSSLPQLEVLKLKNLVSEVCEWKCVEEGFLRLKFLSIHGCNLKSWTLDNVSCFPVLEKLVLINLWDLKEVPPTIGEIPTLQLIRSEKCRASLVISAMKIKEEQESFGNYGLLIQARTSTYHAMRLRERMEIEGFSIDNIHLELYWSRPKRRWMNIYLVLRCAFVFKRIMARKRRLQ